MKTAGVIGSVILAAVLLCGCSKPTVVSEPSSSIWMVDYDAALKQAATENKYVLVNISGMQWCHYCQALEHEVFSQPEFIAYAKDNLICVNLDFDLSGRSTRLQFAEQHEALLTRFMVDGFPTVLILNPQGKLTRQTGYQPGGAAKYVEFIKGVIAADQKK